MVARNISCALAAVVLASCSANDDVSSYLINPGHYSVYHCKDFAPRLQQLVARENELRSLMDRANESDAGAVIGGLAYRAEYENAVGEEKVLRQTAAEKKCDLNPPTYQSDQTIR